MNFTMNKAHALLAGLLTLGAAQAGWAQSYRVEMLLPTGDTIALAGLTDAGDVLLAGYGDFCTGGMSYVINRGGGALGGFVAGLPNDGDLDPTCGVQVSSINSRGDMVGWSFRAQVWQSTFWRDGVAYSLADPANAGLHFVPDAGAHRISKDLSTLDIIDPPPQIRWMDDFYLSQDVYTNARGEFAAESKLYQSSGALLVPVAVPEPATAALALCGLLGLAWCVRRRA